GVAEVEWRGNEGGRPGRDSHARKGGQPVGVFDQRARNCTVAAQAEVHFYSAPWQVEVEQRETLTPMHWDIRDVDGLSVHNGPVSPPGRAKSRCMYGAFRGEAILTRSTR